MRTIHKYSLELTDFQYVQIPEGYAILSVEMQRDKPILYAIVESTAKLTTVGVVIKGTGHLFEEDVGVVDFINTINVHEGRLMFHVFAKQVK